MSRALVVLFLVLAACGDNLPAPEPTDPTALTCEEYKTLQPVPQTFECAIAGHVDFVPGVSFADGEVTWVQTVYQLGDSYGTWGRRDISHASACEWFECIAICDYADGGCP